MSNLSKRIRLAKKYLKTMFQQMPTFQLKVKNNQETLDYILSNNSSVVRFGDGEVLLMCGKGIDYQEYSKELAENLRMILDTPSSEKLVVCIPDVFHDLDRFRLPVQIWWKEHLINYKHFYYSLNIKSWYGSAFIGRPYIDWKKTKQVMSGDDFKKLKQLWKDKSTLIVEGIFSRSGVGNDLFAEAKEVQRILCPPNNAYSDYERIKECVKKYGQGKTILIMLGPTAKILAYELAMEGYRAIDLGHVDSEYEWCKMGVHKKVKLDSKHTAEWNTDECIQDVSDELYHSQIICNLAEDMPTQS